jgi:predicted nuclease with TOPRIM domain
MRRTVPMVTTRKKKNAPRKCDGDALAVAAGTAAASILANIAQVVKGSELKREREQLMEVLAQWQEAYNDLRVKADGQDRELGVARARIAELEKRLGELRKRNLELEKEVADLKRRKKDDA